MEEAKIDVTHLSTYRQKINKVDHSSVNYYDVEKNYFNLHYAVIRDSH